MVPLFRSMVLHYTGGSYKDAPIRFRLHVPESFEPGKNIRWSSGCTGRGNAARTTPTNSRICTTLFRIWSARRSGISSSSSRNARIRTSAGRPPRFARRESARRQRRVPPRRRSGRPGQCAGRLHAGDGRRGDEGVSDRSESRHVGGLSTGGEGTWKIVERRPGLFAAAAPIVSWRAMQEKSLREKPLLKKIPIWAIYSSDNHGIDYARKEFERMRDAGCNVHKTEFGVCGHRAWTPAMLQGDVFGWLISRAKDGDRFYAADASPTRPEKIGIFADVTEGDLGETADEGRARPAAIARGAGGRSRPETPGPGPAIPLAAAGMRMVPARSPAHQATQSPLPADGRAPPPRLAVADFDQAPHTTDCSVPDDRRRQAGDRGGRQGKESRNSPANVAYGRAAPTGSARLCRSRNRSHGGGKTPRKT